MRCGRGACSRRPLPRTGQGDPALAVRSAEAALSLATEPLLHAAVLHRLAIIADWHGQWQDRVVSSETLEREVASVERLDPARAVGLLGVILQRRFQALETREALVLAERRMAMAAGAEDERSPAFVAGSGARDRAPR